MGAGSQPARARRADGHAAGRRRPATVRGRPPPEGAGRVDHLRLAPPRRGVRARRSCHGAARRKAGGDGARGRARSHATRRADRRSPRRDPHPRRAARSRSTDVPGPRPARWQRARDRPRRLCRRDRRARRHHGLRTRARAAAARRADPSRRRRRRARRRRDRQLPAAAGDRCRGRLRARRARRARHGPADERAREHDDHRRGPALPRRLAAQGPGARRGEGPGSIVSRSRRRRRSR